MPMPTSTTVISCGVLASSLKPNASAASDDQPGGGAADDDDRQQREHGGQRPAEEQQAQPQDGAEQQDLTRGSRGPRSPW